MLKWSVSRYFRPPFFSWFKPIKAPDKQAKVFLNSVLIMPRYSNFEKSQQCESYPKVELRGVHGVHHTTESSNKNFSKSSAVCITPRSYAPWCASHHGVKLHGVHHTAESNCTPGSQNRNLRESLVAFKGTIRKNPFRGEHIYHERKDLKKTICDRISRRNRNWIQKYFSLFIRSPDRFQSWEKMVVENLVTHSL